MLAAACGGGDSTGGSGGPTLPTTPVTPSPVPPGILAITASGLADGVPLHVSVVGPYPASTFSRTTTAPVTWTDIPSGRYAITVRQTRGTPGTFAGAPPTFDVDVSSGGLASATAIYRPVPSAMALTISGLPGSAAAAVTITPPNGAPTPVTQTSLHVAPQLATGQHTPDAWRVAAEGVTIDGARYAAAPTALDTVVAFGDTARVNVRYTIATGAIAVVVGGLPASVPGNVLVINPDNSTRTIDRTTTLTGLTPGRYRLVASTVVQQQGQQRTTFRAPADTLDVNVVASLVAAPATFTYVAQAGQLALTVNGLPAQTAGAITLSGNGLSRTFTGSVTIDSLPAGTYTLAATSVSAGAESADADRYAPTPAAQNITIGTGTTATASVTYALASGSLALTIRGLPEGTAGDVVIAGPNGFVRSVRASGLVGGLLVGRYTVTARTIKVGSDVYGVVPASRTIDIVASTTPIAMTLQYDVIPAVIDVPVTGLPAGYNASISLVGPAGEHYAIISSQRIGPAAPGRWRLTASAVTTPTGTFIPTPASRDSVAEPGDTLHFGVRYAINSGSLALAVTGLPAGVSGAVTIAGPSGFSRTATATTTYTSLVPGSYTVTAANVTVGGVTYTPAPTSQVVTVGASNVAAPATVSYSQGTGSINITATGLPAGATPTFQLSNGATTRTQVGPGTVTGLSAVTWTVTAGDVVSGSTTYSPTPATRAVPVPVNGTGAASFVYAAGGGGGGGGLNYRVAGVYLTQAIQKFDGSVPLVAGRDALLRVFVVASGTNSARPDVRVRLYDGAALIQTATIAAPEASVRTATAEGTLGSTWNLLVAGANVRQALRVQVDLDPSEAVTDADRSDNVWPAGGSTQAITVNNVPPFSVRFVPVVTGVLTGNVSVANNQQFLNTARRLWPIKDITADVRLPFTSSVAALQANDENDGWMTVLSELNALRVSDGAPSTMHYYGVVKVTYSSGIAGLGFVPGRSAIGWDYLPSGDEVAAHEWGHNFSRGHAPCGVAGDPSYPYAGGIIANWGWNSLTNALVSPLATDVMSYCNTTWISDYNWSAVMQFRNSTGRVASALTTASTTPTDGLLVWGRVIDGQIQLEPAFRVSAPITPAASRPTHRLDLIDDDGSALLQLPIEAAAVDHATGHLEQQFAVVVPWSAALEARLSAVRVSDNRLPTRSAVRRSDRTRGLAGVQATPGARMNDAGPDATLSRDSRQVRVSWSNRAFAMALVRDQSTGQILGFIREPGAAVTTAGRTVDVVFSDGVRSETVR